eukprot:GEMP01000345.1.p1 GENE.GEMP01000345.1~~GEMP01000345.1.p1  ORF type:complete len:2348 (+),score=515.02 GEMP01000345.1:124-7044(+)
MNYGPFDPDSQKTNLAKYKPNKLVQMLDIFGDKRTEVSPDVLPRSACGALMSVMVMLIIAGLCFDGMMKFANSDTMVVTFGQAVINLDWICNGLGDDRICDWSEKYVSTLWRDNSPFLDVPAVNLTIHHIIEFYEADNKTSLRRITYRDKNGIFHGGTSTNENVPVSVGAHGKVSVPMDSYPIGASPINSENPSVSKTLSDMLGVSLSQAFPTDSLKYMYARWNMFADNEDFFEHDAYVFFRVDPEQMRLIKSCQLQVGLVNALEFKTFQPYLKMHDREMQKNDYLTSIRSTTKSWDPDKYSARTGTYRRLYSSDTLLLVQSKITKERVMELMNTNNIEGMAKVNTSGMLEDDVDLTRDPSKPPLEFVDWMFWVSYVNNFKRTADTMICDGKKGAMFITDKLRAIPPHKDSTVLEIVEDASTAASKIFSNTTFIMDPPFYVVVTGDMGREKMLVMDVNFTSKQLIVVRGSVIGQHSLEFKVARPSNYPSIPKTGAGGWICATSKYMDGKYCDCMCGMTDPDCLLGTLPVLNCNTDGGEICSPLGRCTVPIYQPEEVVISTSCHELILNGEEFVSGFLGHERDQIVWRKIGAGTCTNNTHAGPSASLDGVTMVECKNFCAEYASMCLGFSIHETDVQCRLHFHNFFQTENFLSENKAWANSTGDYTIDWELFDDVCVDESGADLVQIDFTYGDASLAACKEACFRKSTPPSAWCSGVQWHSALSEKKCKLIMVDGNKAAKGAVPSLDSAAKCHVRPDQPVGINNSTGEVADAGWKCYTQYASKLPSEVCDACPWDDLYDGKSNRNEHNKWVCLYRATGEIMAADVMELDEFIADTTNNYNITDFTKGRILKVNLGAKSGFPLLEYSADNTTGRYTVELSNGMGNHELVTVIESVAPTPGENSQSMVVIPLGATTGNEQQFRYTHFATGTLLSALQPEIGDMVIQLETDQKRFDQAGPFKVIVDNSEFIIRSGSVLAVSNSTTSDGRKRKQRLDINNYPKGFGGQGLRSRLVRKVIANKKPTASLFNYNVASEEFEDKEPEDRCLSLYSGITWQSACQCAKSAPDAGCSDPVPQQGIGEFDVIQVFLNIEFSANPPSTITDSGQPTWLATYGQPLIDAMTATLRAGPALTMARDVRVSIQAILQGGICGQTLSSIYPYKVQVHFTIPGADTGELRKLLRSPKFHSNMEVDGYIKNLNQRGGIWAGARWDARHPPVEFLEQFFGQVANFHHPGIQPPRTKLDALGTTKQQVAQMMCNTGTSWATTKFCDGVHDGLLVVEMVGFSDPKVNPKGSTNIKVLIRGADASLTPKMEVRNMTRAYQWRFPHINKNTGDVQRDQEVGLWLCDPSQWMDGTCDCNCGRFDPDCAGVNGNPAQFATQLDLDPTITVRHNCPFGDDMMTPVVGAVACQMPCNQIQSDPATYRFCAHRRGRLAGASATKEAFSGNTLIDRTLLDNYKIHAHDRFLWEVIEIDAPLQTDRDVGVIVESLIVSTDAKTKYHNDYTPDYLDHTNDFSQTNVAYLVDPAKNTEYAEAYVKTWSYEDATLAAKDPTFDAGAAASGEYDPQANKETRAPATNRDTISGTATGASNMPATGTTAAAQTDPAQQPTGSGRILSRGPGKAPPQEIKRPTTFFPRRLSASIHNSAHAKPQRLKHLTYAAKNPHSKSPSATAIFHALGGNLDHYYSKPHRTINEVRGAEPAALPRRLDSQNNPQPNDPASGADARTAKPPEKFYDPMAMNTCDEFTGACDDTGSADSDNMAALDKAYKAPQEDASNDFYTEYVDDAMVGKNHGETLSDFTAQMITQMPEKKVISDSVQSMVDINLFRPPEHSYYPKNRHKPNVKEDYASASNVDLHVAMFAVAKRLPITTLCPNLPITDERLENVFKSQGSIHKDFWGQWRLQPGVVASLTGNTCDVAPFNSSACLDRAEILSVSKHKYRLFCTKNMHPINTLQYTLSSPLNLKWELPNERPESADSMAPEWSTDWNTEYFFTYDANTLRTEQEFMRAGGGNDYMSGVRTLWASGPYVRGRASCNSTGFTDCSMGMPANSPTLLPTLALEVDRERTWKVVQALKPKYWPIDDREKFDALMNTLDGYKLDIQGILRSLVSTEDGYVLLKPATNIYLSLTVSVSPVYRENKLGIISLNRWIVEIVTSRISEGRVDYASKSKMDFRIHVEMVPQAKRYLEKIEYSLTDLLNSVGAWVGYVAIAATLLGFWMRFCKPFGIVNVWECDDAQLEKQVQTDSTVALKLKKKRDSKRIGASGKIANAPLAPKLSDFGPKTMVNRVSLGECSDESGNEYQVAVCAGDNP